MPNIPEDVVIHILESYCGWWPRDLARFAVVSHVWLSPARAHLFARPLLTSYRACFLFYRTLHNDPYLASLVRGLDLKATRTDEECVYPAYLESVPLLLSLPSLRLKELTLGGQLSCQAERFLRAVANPQAISALRITGSKHGLRGEASLEWDTWEFSSRFYGLKKLELIGPMYLEIYRDVMWGKSQVDPGCRLEELHIIGIQSYSGLLSHLFSVTSWSGLRTLVLLADTDDFEDSVQLASLLRTPLPSLETLSIEYRKQYNPYRVSPLFDMNFSSLGHLTRDEEFPDSFFSDVYAPIRSFESLRKLSVTSLCLTADALPTIAQLFPNIQTFNVKERCDNLVSLGEWARFHKEGYLKQLAQFSLVIDGPRCRKSPSEGLDVLRDACSSRNIELSYVTP